MAAATIRRVQRYVLAGEKLTGGDWKDWRLLLVDADNAFLAWAESVFRNVGARDFRCTDSPVEAMEMLKSFPADAALIGIQLKGISGVEFVYRLRNRKISPKPDLPIILVVEAADPKALRNACQIGIENFVRKPVEPDILVKRVFSTIRNPRRFVVTRAYFGPERRRRQIAFEGPERRRANLAIAQTGVRPVRSPEDNVPLVDAAPVRPRRPRDENIPLVDAAPSIEDKAAGWKEALVEDEAVAQPPAEPTFDVKHLAEQHLAWVRSGGKEGVRASFAGADLHGINLSGISLSNANFSGADLSDANCEKVDFSGADLRRAILANANLKDGQLGVAQMRHSVLERATLEGAVLRGADLAGANLQGAMLKMADFSGANMLSTNLRAADLSEATGLTQAQLDRCLGNSATKLPPGLRIVNSDD